MFIVALFMIAKTWKQHKRPSTEDWTKKMWYRYHNGILLSHKNNVILPSETTWMDLEGIMLSERQILYVITYM